MDVKLDHSLIQKADIFADKAHAGHTRSNKSKEPYIGHLREVAELLRISGGTTEEICAGLLHDSVEDTEVTLDEISLNFGNSIKEMVEELTDDPESNKLPTLERKILQMNHMKSAPLSVKKIKLADQISNIRCVATDPPEKWSVQKCIDYIEGARLISQECFSISEYLDVQFQEALTLARSRYPDIKT